MEVVASYWKNFRNKLFPKNAKPLRSKQRELSIERISRIFRPIWMWTYQGSIHRPKSLNHFVERNKQHHSIGFIWIAHQVLSTDI